MAVSGRTQAGMFARNADITEYVATRSEADALASEWRRGGYYKRVQVYPWNNGTKEAPRTEFKVLAWLA